MSMIAAMSTELERPGPGRREHYVHFLPHSLRWMDNDVFGHLNNAHYYSLFDTTICEFLAKRRILLVPGATHHMMMAESGCRYLREVAFPEPVAVGLRIGRLGRSSVRYELALFRDGDDLARAEGFMVHVCVAAADRRPAPLPPEWRAMLEELIISN